VYSASFSDGQQYFTATLMLPVDRELLLVVESDEVAKIRGHVFFSYVYDEAMSHIVQVQSSLSPVLFRTYIEDD